jgi:hypothetical protein
MFNQVLNYAIRGDAPLLRELGIDPKDILFPVVVRLEIEPGTQLEGDLPQRFEIDRGPNV